MTEEQIIKALEWCDQFENNIVFKGNGDKKCLQALQVMVVIKHSLKEYKRQKEKIEILEAKNSELRIGLKVIKRTEIKKLWERLEKEIRYCTDVYGNSIQAINVECANRIVKEMVGE